MSSTQSPERAGRTSTSSTRASLDKVVSNTSTSSTSERRTSQPTGLYHNLHQYKRGSEDYQQRRASHADMNPPTGIFGGWFNSTFRGMSNNKN